MQKIGKKNLDETIMSIMAPCLNVGIIFTKIIFIMALKKYRTYFKIKSLWNDETEQRLTAMPQSRNEALKERHCDFLKKR